MTVLDTSAVVDLLLGSGAWVGVASILTAEGVAAVPDVLVFEVLAVLRRDVARGILDPGRGTAAVHDLQDVSVDVFPSLPLRGRAWQLRHNMTAADALFVALAEALGEPFATKDRGLVTSTRDHTDVEVIELAP